MKTQTKQELRDRIAELEIALKCTEQHLHTQGKVAANIERYEKAKAKHATLAAYALLATLTAIIIMEFGF